MKTAYNVNPKMINNLLDEVFGNDGLVTKGWNAVEKTFQRIPPVNITKSDQAFYLELMVAGIPKELIQIEVKENILVVSYEYKEELDDAVQVIKSEFGKSSFERKFKIDEKIDAKGINAQYENGILKLTLPLKEDRKPVEMKISIS